MSTTEWTRGAFRISCDPARLDFEVIHTYLTRSYWKAGVSRDQVEAAARGSMCFGVYHHETQVGYARVIGDRSDFAYLADVFILEAYQGKGLGKWLMTVIFAHPELAQIKNWLLRTADAHGLYAQFGFHAISNPGTLMERRT